MTSRQNNVNDEAAFRLLVEQARFLWGEDRAALIQDSLEGLARQLHELGPHLPDPRTEPGFYQ